MDCVVIIVYIFDFFQDVNRIHDEKYHPCPLIICVVIDNILAFFPTQTWSCVGYTLSSLLFLKMFLEYFCDLQIQFLLEHHVIATPKHDCGTPNINKNIGSAMLNVS